jgi:hypothetical protein
MRLIALSEILGAIAKRRMLVRIIMLKFYCP